MIARNTCGSGTFDRSAGKSASTAVGFRHGISGHFLATLFSVNLEHQILSYGDTVRHDLLFTVGLNLTVPFLAFLL